MNLMKYSDGSILTSIRQRYKDKRSARKKSLATDTDTDTVLHCYQFSRTLASYTHLTHMGKQHKLCVCSTH